MNNALTQTVFGDLLNKKFTLAYVLSMLDKMDLLQNGQLAELAISKSSGVKLCSKLTKNIDLVSGKQIKHARTHFRDGRWQATISRNTTAPMLVVISETNTSEHYYLNIPYKAHSHMSGNTIGISFGEHGTSLNSHWWKYRVNSSNELCELAK